MFSLSLREQVLVTAVILAVVLGVSVKHWRDANRESMASHLPAASMQPSTTRPSLPPVAQAHGPMQHP